jgi:N-methylhydantoinase A
MGLLVNIDNGGTLTDICVSEGTAMWRTKTLTTPFDLSKCLMDGLKKASGVVYGEDDVERLLLATDHIRYSTTQGTNALVQRKGPRLGLIYGGGWGADALRERNPDLFDSLVGDRAAELPIAGDEGRYDAVRAVSDLAARGANRIVIAFGTETRVSDEKALKRDLLRAFPPHLLGAVPLLYSHEIAGDDDDVRRTWTALFNAFLHPAMEQFLYSAEQRLREARAQKPLLIFRNDGQSARVAKTTAVKTYSSGPRGGADGAVKLANHYGFDRLISVDIGGTTTDISVVEHGVARAHTRGTIAGIETSFPLIDVSSVGVGGSSIICVEGGRVRVGPESVGSTPGPACFGLGGTDATITDAFFSSGLLDPATYFGGAMTIDLARAKAAVANAIGTPLGLDEDAAIAAMEAAWIAGVADGIRKTTDVDPETVLAAFGGGGPLVICRIAENLGIKTVLIPKLAAVFSAFGIGFSDVGHTYEAQLKGAGDRDSVHAKLLEQAKRGMIAEGVDPSACAVAAEDVLQDHTTSLRLTISKALPHPVLTGRFHGATVSATPSGSRTVLLETGRQSVPLFLAAELADGSGAAGPAVLEEEFFTCRIDSGWQFSVNEAGDILITRSGS